MTAAIALRDYQDEALSALEADWSNGLHKIGVAAPTGVGKTVIMAHLAHRNHRGRVLITVHRDELVQQTVDKLRRVDPTLSVGIVKAAMNQAGADVVVASIATISRPNRLAQLGRFGLVIVDEAHRSMSDQYQRVLAALDPDGTLRVAGFTATWSRSDSRGLGDYWEKISWRRSTRWAISQGHLVKPVGKRVVTDLDLSDVKRTAGDYNERALGVAMTDESIAEAIIDAYARHAADRKGVLFAPTVASAEFFADRLCAAGFPTEGMFGSTNDRDTRAMHRRFEPGGPTQILATCVKLAEGWDAPWCSAAVLARPTLHSGLFIQQVGRVLRPYAGKTDAIILDVVGTTDQHSLHADIELGTTPPPRDPDDEDFDLEDELDEDGDGPDPLAKATARVAGYEDVDLFASSGAHWLYTYSGTPFVRCRDATTYFLWPDGQRWAVGRIAQGAISRGSWLVSGADPDYALEVAAQHAVEYDSSVSVRRVRNRWGGAPSSRQAEYALSLGLDPSGLDRRQLADAIDINLASRLLSALV